MGRAAKRKHAELLREQKMMLQFRHVGSMVVERSSGIRAVVAAAARCRQGVYPAEGITVRNDGELFVELVYIEEAVPRSLWIRPGYLERRCETICESQECGYRGKTLGLGPGTHFNISSTESVAHGNSSFESIPNTSVKYNISCVMQV